MLEPAPTVNIEVATSTRPAFTNVPSPLTATRYGGPMTAAIVPLDRLCSVADRFETADFLAVGQQRRQHAGLSARVLLVERIGGVVAGFESQIFDADLVAGRLPPRNDLTAAER